MNNSRFPFICVFAKSLCRAYRRAMDFGGVLMQISAQEIRERRILRRIDIWFAIA
jgi:hypothetical protein